ncbi:MAG: hypothetical protein D6692_05420 [Planctomycetota bacterium]|nr:MAG: hypothetical protein D6692_05420 [Planctomycetota bacterium]
MKHEETLAALMQMNMSYRISNAVRKVDGKDEAGKPIKVDEYFCLVEFFDESGATAHPRVECHSSEVEAVMADATRAIAKKKGFAIGHTSESVRQELEELKKKVRQLEGHENGTHSRALEQQRDSGEPPGKSSDDSSSTDAADESEPGCTDAPSASDAPTLRQLLVAKGVKVRKNATQATIRRLAVEHGVLPGVDDS